jgi:hypothetical protein
MWMSVLGSVTIVIGCELYSHAKRGYYLNGSMLLYIAKMSLAFALIRIGVSYEGW